MNEQVIAFESYFEDAARFRKWAMEKFSTGEEIITAKMDDQTRGYLRVDSSKNQQETHQILHSLLLDRGAHMLEAISKLQPNQVCRYLL